jgi:hypothetical protein
MPEALDRMCRSGREFTFAGGLLACLTLILTLAFAWFVPFWLFPRILPPGTAYPVLVLAIAVIGFGAAFFAGAAWIMDRIGLPATKPPKNIADDKA